MKVRIEFDTVGSPMKAKIFHDGEQQELVFNVFLVLTPHDLPTYCLNMPEFVVDVFLKGLEKAVSDAKKRAP